MLSMSIESTAWHKLSINDREIVQIVGGLRPPQCFPCPQRAFGLRASWHSQQAGRRQKPTNGMSRTTPDGRQNFKPSGSRRMLARYEPRRRSARPCAMQLTRLIETIKTYVRTSESVSERYASRSLAALIDRGVSPPWQVPKAGPEQESAPSSRPVASSSSGFRRKR